MKRPAIICDIDGTVADITHRLHYIKGPVQVGDIVRPIGVPDAKRIKYKVVNIRHAGWGPIYSLMGVSQGHVGDDFSTFNIDIHYRKVKSYSKFYDAVSDDDPIDTTIILVTEFANALGIPIIFCSGRPDSCVNSTVKWLQEHIIEPHGVVNHDLFMRETGDMRKDYIVKQEIYEKYIEPLYDIIAVFDDRQQVVDMWRDLGLQCYQVAKGDF